MELGFLRDLVLVFGASALSVSLLHKLRIPPLVGFIAAGVLIGPNGLGIIRETHEIELLAEIGVILLLFIIGVEFSLKRMRAISKTITVGGGGQVLLTIAAIAAISYSFTCDMRVSVFLGFLAALSSTAIVTKILFDHGQIDAPRGRAMLGILIFQDLCIVPLMLMVPTLAGERLDVLILGFTVFKAAAIIVVVLLSSRWIVPEIFHQVVSTKSRELFTITVIFICLGTALLTSKMGLSLALGAFLAGLVISESEYAYEATAKILPFKDSFMGLFFVSIGMLVDTSYMAGNWLIILGAVLTISLIKTVSSTVSLIFTSVTPRIALQAGFGLFQIGEFSFILADAGRSAGLISGDMFQLFLSATVLTMGLTPFVMTAAPSVSERLMSSWPLKRFEGTEIEEKVPEKVSDHVIIIGFGLSGRKLAATLRESGVPYVVLDLNSGTVREEKKDGQPIYFGDATSMELLNKLGAGRARLMVIAISDPAASRKIVALAKKGYPGMRIIVRTRYLLEVEDLRSLGADEVIPEEFETSVEIFSRVLSHYNVPRNVIAEHIENIRRNEYKVLRTMMFPTKPITERHKVMSAIETGTYLVKEGSPLAGRTLRDIELRTRTGATVISIERDQKAHLNPSPDLPIKENDIIMVVGKREDIGRTVEYLDSISE